MWGSGMRDIDTNFGLGCRDVSGGRHPEPEALNRRP